jgi:very-short-patch-repair endonuclease
MTRNELLDIYRKCNSKREFANALGIKTNGVSGSNLNKVLYEILSKFDIVLDLSMQGFVNKRYYENPKRCKNCGKIITKRKNEFCSHSCSATYSNKRRRHTSETREKISGSVRKFLSEGYKEHITDYTRKCIICGKEFSIYRGIGLRASRSKTCSIECNKILRSRNSAETIKRLKAEGRFQGWKSRNITSYAEKFWMTVLSNNGIEYTREKKIGKYFIDFYIKNGDTVIDLEIDGKQHKYKDRHASDIERDKYLSSLGIIVYRVEWNSINTETGSSKMKLKIDQFLNFYNTMRK